MRRRYISDTNIAEHMWRDVHCFSWSSTSKKFVVQRECQMGIVGQGGRLSQGRAASVDLSTQRRYEGTVDV